MYVPFPIYKHLQRSLKNLITTDDFKYSITDQNVRNSYSKNIEN